MDNIIKRILMVPQSTPREALYIETGLLDPEAIRLKNRVLMEHRLTNGNSQRMKKLITNNTTTSKWAEETKKAKEQLEIDERDMKGEKTTVKNRITNRVKDWFKAKIEKESNEKSKIQHLLEGLTGWEPQKRARYMNKLTRQQASTIFKARTRMLPAKNNYRNKHRNHTCRACGELVESQKHVLEDCEILHLVGEYKVYNKEIFSDNPNKLRTTATNIQNLMDQLNNIAENEVTTTPKQPKTKQTSTARQKKGLSSPATRGSTQWWWRLWMDGLNLNVILMFLPIWFCHTAAIASTWQPVQNLSTALPARGCHALQNLIGWELSCTCIVTSWSQRPRSKHGGLADRWGSTCHAYGRKFAIKIQCWWHEKYVNLKMKT